MRGAAVPNGEKREEGDKHGGMWHVCGGLLHSVQTINNSDIPEISKKEKQ